MYKTVVSIKQRASLSSLFSNISNNYVYLLITKLIAELVIANLNIAVRIGLLT